MLFLYDQRIPLPVVMVLFPFLDVELLNGELRSKSKWHIMAF